MISSVLRLASRTAMSRSTFVARNTLLLQQRQPVLALQTLRHFSAPPVFLDASEVTDRILSVVKNFDQVDSSKVTPEVKWVDLGLDSLDAVEVVMAIEDEFAVEIPDPEADKILSVAEAIEYISTHPMAK
uniref:Acyl carrier protein n=1 Tax=Entomoneis paludosa TaxID=265537 RepID=A0A6U3DNS7_9STRA|mmetsp:Transcript_4944/g.10488  ORF Transcript_4944/g.10488 Transcript_4944/m.10488 type:complete len:130 (+) Transcript_4944:102-491(+)|eukprot:CAMPEP_0172439506 /NCGR_PEP_ID=MMETSP1065-20121228/466_1 /TAXON_ID=265537 /ORGANISM="Amphiprora paludosa, Strain CCMP125" /LENGTH=129 /DNA_ID=CAMNT_0013188195 /DNA_START=56 /DNA_END=445 /DNA_ORIENTATION=+